MKKKKKKNKSKKTINPIILFKRWMKIAKFSPKISYFNAMILATFGIDEYPYQRIVFLKKMDQKGIVFYTNFQSRKAKQISNSEKISLHFPWQEINRQVLILGTARMLKIQESKKYFYSRPKEHQISAISSHQSEIIFSRKKLLNSFIKLKRKFRNKNVPFPNFCGGYLVEIKSIEFWKKSKYRLHERIVYKKIKNNWILNRLSP
ncbi:pyridoxamine 5'-phosphate oxidase [bacterium endosymbiont of Pedicinus badii]|uniref:pyridoxamine 5'-phosphate oxidase n=1 Tax=bacterium endosymbiont of Pedicinus badii TaxID=1719126 RepID=UPI0009B951CD|nr:pyridoxamine 5'-phosphate oxidase [bacterium endosymbiont of Pedicinus badii]OQM34400.1 hypothetical protein AOQ89_00730 [bacterium endosymbiont of Pedicinus badii]